MAIPQLPQELFIEILLRLPVKSLKRCRCLSKPLCRVIDSSDFIKSHLCKSSENFNLRKLIFTDEPSKKFHIYDVNLDLNDEILRLEKPVSSLLKGVYGYSKGMILLNRSTLTKKFRLAMWNPSIRKRKHLPDCPFVIGSNVQYYCIIGSGLGYDESVDDFKAFYIVHVQGKEERDYEFQSQKHDYEIQVWIYQLKADVWGRSCNNLPYKGLRMDRVQDSPGIGQFTADGNLNWLCSFFGNKWKTEIVAFDVRKETFSLVPQPDCAISSVEGVESELHVLEGSLCISYFSVSVLPEAHLYIRKKDGGDQFGWAKLYSVTESLFFDIMWFEYVKVLGYCKRGDKVLLDFGMPFMVSYDPKDESFEKVEIDKDPTWKAPILCQESLVVLTC